MLLTQWFLQKTQLLNLVRGERDHENYGTTHTIKHIFVDEKEKICYSKIINLIVDPVETPILKELFL